MGAKISSLRIGMPGWARTMSLTARFGATTNPLANARGSDRSPDREGGVAPNSTTSQGHSTSTSQIAGRKLATDVVRQGSTSGKLCAPPGCSAEDDLKAFLYEMVVVGQDLHNPLASHGRHGYAVHKAVALVIALLVQT